MDPQSTEWWTTVIAAVLSAALAWSGVPGSTAAQIVAIAAPVLLAVVYGIARTHHKQALATVLAAAFPRSDETA